MDIFLDESKIFKCQLKIEGASLSKSKCRLLIKTDDLTLIQEGTINDNGTVEIQIPKLKRFIESKEGTAILEVIADDMFFSPYTDTIKFKNKYVVEVIGEEKTKINKPVISVTHVATKQTPVKTTFQKPLSELIYNISKKNITIENINKNGKTIRTLLESTMRKYKLNVDFIEYAIKNIPKYLK